MSLSFNYNIVKRFGTISKRGSRLKLLNYISYDGRPPVYDLRVWETTEQGTMMHKGITFTEEELRELRTLLNNMDAAEQTERQGTS